MKPIAKKTSKKTGFTIVELLTVMSIIVILLGLLVPGLNKVRRYARKVRQKNQFYAISVALDLFNAEWEAYPESKLSISGGYGAIELCEAVMGRDLQGYTPNTADYNNPDTSGRKPYLPIENANVYQLKCLYGAGTTNGDRYVLCDVYKTVKYNNPDNPLDSMNGKRVGMPILYYKANTSGTTHSVKKPFYDPEVDNGISIDDPDNIYKYEDNDSLVQLGIPWVLTTLVHLMDSTGGDTLHTPPLNKSTAQVFYNKTWNDTVTGAWRPHRGDSYILLSAGFDGEYGTRDDVFNFGN